MSIYFPRPSAFDHFGASGSVLDIAKWTNQHHPCSKWCLGFRCHVWDLFSIIYSPIKSTNRWSKLIQITEYRSFLDMCSYNFIHVHIFRNGKNTWLSILLVYHGAVRETRDTLLKPLKPFKTHFRNQLNNLKNPLPLQKNPWNDRCQHLTNI